MRKFKLIKEYPGSPGLNNIVYKQKANTYGLISSPYGISWPEQHVESDSEYWEEIIEKDYEILSYYNQFNNCYYRLDSQLNNRWCNKDGIAPFYKEEDLNFCSIHSVKRLSDGEIFTIGDKITCMKQEFVITSFETNKYKMLIANWYNSKNSFSGSNILYLEHSKKPLFTTKDGVEIFDNDFYWMINKGCWIAFEFKAEERLHYNHEFLSFSTKKAAEEYMIMNKPCLSYNDVIAIRKVWFDNHLSLVDTIKELVKSKYGY